MLTASRAPRGYLAAWRVPTLWCVGAQVGQQVNSKMREDKEEEEAFERADAKTRNKILAVHRRRMLDAAKKRFAEETQAETAKLGEAKGANKKGEDGGEGADEEGEDEADEEALINSRKSIGTQLRDANFQTLVNQTRPVAGKLRFYFKPDRKRSRAYPLLPAEDRPEPEEEETKPLGELQA